MAEDNPKGKPIPVSLNHAERAKWRRGIAACKKTTHAAYRIVTVLEDMMSRERNGEAFPSQAALSSFTGISVRDLRRHTKALADDGWLEVLDGKDRTRPKSKRGSHYRPMWPDEETKTRCMNNEFIQNSDNENTTKTGQGCPVSGDVKTGHFALQNRPSKVAKPAKAGRSHRRDGRETDRTTEGKPPHGGFPHQNTYRNSDSRDALGLRRASSTGEEREDTFTADEAHSFFAEAFEALCASGDDPSFASQDQDGQRDHDEAERQSSAGENQDAADADTSDRDLLERCEMQFGGLCQADQFLVDEMSKTLDAGRDLTAGQRRLLRDEIIPIVQELESQPEPPEIAWDGESEKNSASGETNAPAT